MRILPVNLFWLCCFSLLLTACESTPHVRNTIRVNHAQPTELAPQQSEIGKDIKIYEIPLLIDTPQDAILKIDFKVKDTGHCMTTYEPTVFYLNNKQIITFDFRRFFLKKHITRELKLTAAQFQTGKNTLKIETGYCQYDIDVLKLNSLILIL